MPDDLIPLLVGLFIVLGAVYSAVGHAGASGYLAVMALLGVDALVMRPTALTINVLVATIAFVQFFRAGYFSWRLFWPFAAASVPAAFVGGRVPIPQDSLRVAIGLVLLLSAVRMAWVALRARGNEDEPVPPPLGAALSVGGALGFVAGLTGTGGGIFLSPVMLILGWASPKRTAAVASLFVLVNSVAGLGGLASKGWTPPTALPVLATAACAGGLVGSYLGSRRATPRVLNFVLAAVLLLAGGKLVLL